MYVYIIPFLYVFKNSTILLYVHGIDLLKFTFTSTAMHKFHTSMSHICIHTKRPVYIDTQKNDNSHDDRARIGVVLIHRRNGPFQYCAGLPVFNRVQFSRIVSLFTLEMGWRKNSQNRHPQLGRY